MMWHTYAALAASAVCLLLPLMALHDPSLVAVLMVFAVAGALMPDLDAVESKLKHVRLGRIKPLVPVARAINRDFGHRGLMHSLCGLLTGTLLVLPLIG